MKILVLSCIHNQIDKLAKVLDKVNMKNIDMIICNGDFTDMFYNPSDFDQVDMCEVLVEKLLALNKPLLVVPGNHDPYETLDVFEDYGINLHGKFKNVGGINFVGFGGAATPFNTIFEPSEEEIERTLNKNADKILGGILVVHNPPKDTKCDKVSTGEHVGSANIRKTIEHSKPLLVICGHIHEAFSVDKIGNSVILNPGAVFENRFALVEIKGKDVKCELKDV